MHTNVTRMLFGIALVISLAVVGFATPQAAVIVYNGTLTGPAESPPNASPGIGSCVVEVDATAHTMRVYVTFSGLVGITTASHIHAATAVPGTGTAGVATTPTFADFR